MDQALNAVSNYCELWKLKINVNKKKIIRFAKRKHPNPNNQYDFLIKWGETRNSGRLCISRENCII